MTTAARQRGTFFLAGLLFFLSGAASLAYEVVWVKLLTLQFGSAAWSITTVVASFMAGLGAGGAWAGRRADRIARPLKAYGLLELGIALYGALSVPLLENMAGLLNPLYGLVDSAFWAYMLAQFLLSVLMLAVPTFLMGASLPLLIVAVSQQGTFRRSVALFYGINTLGAAAGTCVTGIALLPALGIAHSVSRTRYGSRSSSASWSPQARSCSIAKSPRVQSPRPNSPIHLRRSASRACSSRPLRWPAA